MSLVTEKIDQVMKLKNEQTYNEKIKVSLTLRVSPFTVHLLEKIGEELDESRSAIGAELLSDATIEAADYLSYDLTELMVDFSKKQKK